MQKVTLTKVYWGEVDTQYGKAQKIGIKTDVHGDKWLSCFENKQNTKQLRPLQEGQTVEIIVTQNGDFLNFRIPTRFDYVEQDVEKLKAAVFGTGANTDNSQPPTEAKTGENPDDIPF